MQRLVMLVLLCVTSPAWSGDGIDVTNPEQVASLLNIQDKLDSVSTAVMACIDSGKAHAVCLCESEATIIDFNGSVMALFDTHPTLKDQDLVSFKGPDDSWISQSLAGIKQQAAMALSCP